MFLILSLNLILSSFLIFISKNPIYSIFYLIFCFLNAALILMYFGLDFIAILILLIYIGAIAILFIFIIMMLNLKLVDLKESFITYFPLLFFFLFFILFGFISYFYFFFENISIINYSSFSSNLYYLTTSSELYFSIPLLYRTTQYFSYVIYLYINFLLWLAGILLLSAMVGIIIISLHKNLYVKRQNFYNQIIKDEQYAISLENRIFKKKLNWNYFLNNF